MNKLIKIALSLLLVLCITFAALTPSLASENASDSEPRPSTDASAAKEEVIYANLENDGTAKKVYVVNVFESAGGGNVKDSGDYESVINLTDTSGITLNGGVVSFSMPSGRFYYQGNMNSTQLPWNIGIAYYLDGLPVSAGDIAGRSGALEIVITTRDTDYAEKAFYENYMLQVSVTLDTSKCTNISADGAVLANAGKNKVINFTVMPESQSKLVLSADVTDFEMQGIQISGIPLSLGIETPDTGSLSEDFSLLSDAIKQLSDGASLLSDGIVDFKYSFTEYRNGFSELSAGSDEFLSGIGRLTEQNDNLTGGSAAILDGLKNLSASLDTGDFSGLGQLSELPDALYQLSAATAQAASGLKELESGFSQGYSALSDAVNALPSDMMDSSVITALSSSTDPNVLTLLNAYQNQYSAIMTLKGTFTSLTPLFDGVSPALSQSASGLSDISLSLLNMSTALKESLTGSDINASVGGLKAGVDLIVTNYETFHQGLLAYADGVKGLQVGYAEFDKGITELYGATGEISGGINELSEGAGSLSAGTEELYNETGDIDGMISDKISELMSGYDKSDFVATSFVSEGRTVSSVQFVFKTEGIAKPEPESPAPVLEEKLTLWDRLLNLFGL